MCVSWLHICRFQLWPQTFWVSTPEYYHSTFKRNASARCCLPRYSVDPVQRPCAVKLQHIGKVAHTAVLLLSTTCNIVLSYWHIMHKRKRLTGYTIRISCRWTFQHDVKTVSGRSGSNQISTQNIHVVITRHLNPKHQVNEGEQARKVKESRSR